MSAVPDNSAANDPDLIETQEWLDALEAVIEQEGPERAHYLLERLIDQARRSGATIPFSPNTAYINTIPTQLEDRSPGDHLLEERIRSYARWNAMVMPTTVPNRPMKGATLATVASIDTRFSRRLISLVAARSRARSTAARLLSIGRPPVPPAPVIWNCAFNSA